MDIATGAPEVISRRLAMFNQPGPWTQAAMREAQRMVLEKLLAAHESWWAVVRTAFTAGLVPPVGSALWLRPPSKRATQQAMRAAHQVLHPVSRRVNANVKRLRNKKN
ncbi:MAG: hypothetical protein E6H79_00745 [Betaproteobacteria bacterium]|nr:MAG: hypothetical protein E6H79_00745 [Betaproteobacteria bacterium]